MRNRTTHRRNRLGLACALAVGVLTAGLVAGPAFAADDADGPDDTDPSSTEMATSSALSGAITDDADEAASDTEGKAAATAKSLRVIAALATLPDDDDATTTDDSGATAAVTYKTLTITTQMQQRSYWCGPAAGRATLTAFGVTKTQGALATSMRTTVGGTAASKIYTTLNTYESRNFYYDDKGTASAKYLFARVKTDIGSLKAPVIPLVQGHSLPIWTSNGYHGLHFISLYGYGSDGVSIKYFDPADADVLYGRHVVNRKYVYAAMNAKYGSDSKADNELVW
ncbi:C39 family peptidase [Streptomyces hokutonensis]|uniref:C39 family peptidase n=1 Tax=Streptomyces hokutonensis TaxID=1306990 RepID=A0ABW6MIN6_9ACTN